MHTLTPVEVTDTAIGESFARIQIYAETNHSVPPSLNALPKRKGYANQITDGWHRPLLYRVTPDGVITITSLGRDGKLGGAGEDADISVNYHSKRPDGTLWVGSDSWIIHAQIK
jgi:hypothetical protein